MSNEKSVFDRFIGELRNRRVFRVATVYLGVGFALLEATDILVPKLGLPGATVLVVLGMLMIGFPIAVILAWHYQFTSDGIRKSPKSGEKQTSEHKPLTSNGIIIALLIVIAALLAFPRMDSSISAQENSISQAQAIDPKSIAVLPFTSFTDEREDEIFADGMHDDILTQLSKIRALRVVSRTTMMKYKDTDKSIVEIAGEVGVANLLEGSVRRAGDQVRIVAQLINAKTDEHLWAETYDRDYADIFSIQSDVARKIAGALQSTLTDEESAQLDEVPTENMQAYDFFLKGNFYWYTKTTKQGNLQAVAMYEEAIKLDPNFGLAYARQSIAHSVLYQAPAWDPTPERKELARKSLDKARLLIPDHPETHFAHGIFYIWCLEDRDSAIREFEVAAEGQPKNSEIANHLGQLYAEKGEWKEALMFIEKAYELDPDALGNAGWLGGVRFMLRNFKLSENYHREAVEKFPEVASGYRFLAETIRYGYGDLDGSRKILREGVLNSGRPDLLASHQFQNEVESRNFKQALEILETSYVGEFPLYLHTVLGFYSGDRGRVDQYLGDAKIELTQLLADQPERWVIHARLGILTAIGGDGTEALRYIERALELNPVSENALSGPLTIYYRAFTHAILGNTDAALKDLELLLSFNSGMTQWDIRVNPFFESLRNHPGFLKLTGQNV